MNLVSVCRNIVKILNLSSFLSNMPENMQTVRMFFKNMVFLVTGYW